VNAGSAVPFVLLVTIAGRTASVAAQAPPAPAVDDTRIGASLSRQTLDDLPSGGDLYQILETTQADVTADRFHAAGLDTGRPPRLGAFLTSWTQTQFRVGDVDVTIPDGSGAPFMFPLTGIWERVRVDTISSGADVDAPGLSVSLTPVRPLAVWRRRVDGSFSGGALAADPPGTPPIARLIDWTHANFVTSGPVGAKAGVGLAATYSRAAQADRGVAGSVAGEIASLFANVVFTPGTRDSITTLGWLQDARYPFSGAAVYNEPLAADRDRFGHIQSTWERHLDSGASWRAFGSYSHRDQARNLGTPVSGTVERLTDGPVPDAADTGDRRDDRWGVGGRIASAPRVTGATSHTFTAGIDIGGARGAVSPGFSGRIVETIDGAAARAWQFSSPAIDASRHETTTSAFIAYRLSEASRLQVDGSVRYDGVSGAADGALTGIAWHSVLPRLALRWNLTRTASLSLFAGAGRSADHLTLNLLAVGDPAAPTALVSGFSASGGLTPVVARVGPGTGGDPAFASIDPDLARPFTDEIVVGVSSEPLAGLQLQFAGVAKREHNRIALVDTGAPASSYAMTTVVDSIADPAHPEAVQQLPVFSRLPSTFGADRYSLTNPGEDAATFTGLVFNAAASTGRLQLLLGATASQTDGPAANRGFHAGENDIGVIGELFTNPNAATFARARLFFDRAYTVKLASTYHFGGGVTVGALARYQDGQPFSRMVIATAPNQGAEAIRAFPSGDSRFTYVGTLDFRLQKRFVVAGREVHAILDAYNAINLGNEVEERVVTGPGFRTITAIQPPRAIHLGFRFSF
jgi:hypothetical protein